MSDGDDNNPTFQRDMLRRFLAPQSWAELLDGRGKSRRSGSAARREARAWTAFVLAAEDAGLLVWDKHERRWGLTPEGLRAALEDAGNA